MNVRAHSSTRTLSVPSLSRPEPPSLVSVQPDRHSDDTPFVCSPLVRTTEHAAGTVQSPVWTASLEQSVTNIWAAFATVRVFRYGVRVSTAYP
jgi:hypothetical protein